MKEYLLGDCWSFYVSVKKQFRQAAIDDVGFDYQEFYNDERFYTKLMEIEFQMKNIDKIEDKIEKSNVVSENFYWMHQVLYLLRNHLLLEFFKFCLEDKEKAKTFAPHLRRKNVFLVTLFGVSV